MELWFLCTALPSCRPFTGVSRFSEDLSGPKTPKSLRVVFPDLSLKKVPKRSKSPKEVSKISVFLETFRPYWEFLRLGTRDGKAWEDFVETFSGVVSPEGLETPVDGWQERKHSCMVVKSSAVDALFEPGV